MCRDDGPSGQMALNKLHNTSVYDVARLKPMEHLVVGAVREGRESEATKTENMEYKKYETWNIRRKLITPNSSSILQESNFNLFLSFWAL